MNRNRVMKVGILACSLAIAGTYVGYRVVSARESQETPPTPAAAPDAISDRPAYDPDEMFAGSKSMPFAPSFVDPPAGAQATGTPAPPAQKKDSPMMGGSKSVLIVDPKDVKPPAGSK
jgi:hypothetical protein